MKKLMLAICVVLALDCQAQKVPIVQPVIPGINASIIMGGHFNGTTKTNGSATASTVKSVPNAVNKVWYTKRDTVNNTGVDTLKQEIRDMANAVYTWATVTSISGTNTSCTLTLWGVGSNSDITSAVPIYTVTVSATGYYGYRLDNWNYNALWWSYKGVGTHSSSWQAGLKVQ